MAEKPTYAVLLAEDTPLLAMMYTDILESLGCTVTHVTNGSDAYECFQRGKFDAIVTDYQMPGTNGLHLLQALNRFPNGRIRTLFHSSDNIIEGLPIEKIDSVFEHVVGHKKSSSYEETERYLTKFVNSLA